jgi:hypothetical protein
MSEFDNNVHLMALAFAHLFLRAMGLPKGGFTTAFREHLFRFYDGRFEQDMLFVATLYNQMQRHATIRKATRVAARNAETLEKMGVLANSRRFYETLQWSQDHPHSEKAKRINAKLRSVIQVIGATPPFSQLERKSNRIRTNASRYRYGIFTSFVTIAPPEHESLACMRQILIAQTKSWNDRGNKLTTPSCTREDLPEEVRINPMLRQRMTRQWPAIASEVFEDTLRVFFESILRCPENKNTKRSRDYLERLRGAMLATAAHHGVIEGQHCGRAHMHLMQFGSALNPHVLSQLAICGDDETLRAVAHILESVTHTNLSAETLAWMDEQQELRLAPNPPPCLRTADISTPDPASGLAAFRLASEKRATLTGIHKHQLTCTKGARGKCMCRLCMARGLHEGQTTPVHLTLVSKEDRDAGIRAVVTASPIADDLAEQIDRGYNLDRLEFATPHVLGPILWELHRLMESEMFVEASLLISGLINAHHNGSFVLSEGAGEGIAEYTNQYMEKEGKGLEAAASVMLAAIDHLHAHPSVAANSGEDVRTGQHFATRVVNSLTAATEFSVPIMLLALRGRTSIVTSESYWYIFPHDNVNYVDRMRASARLSAGGEGANSVGSASNEGDEDDDDDDDDDYRESDSDMRDDEDDEQSMSGEDDSGQSASVDHDDDDESDEDTRSERSHDSLDSGVHARGDGNNGGARRSVNGAECIGEDDEQPSGKAIKFAESVLDEVQTAQHDDYVDMLEALGDCKADPTPTTGGTNEFKLADGTIVYVTHAESYKYRGEHFVDFNPQEFHCIVDLVKKKQTPMKAPQPTTEREYYISSVYFIFFYIVFSNNHTNTSY